MSKNHKAGEVANCPHCDKPMDGPVDDYVVLGPHGKVGHRYTDSCGWCDGEFSVIRNADGSFTVEAEEASEDED